MMRGDSSRPCCSARGGQTAALPLVLVVVLALSFCSTAVAQPVPSKLGSTTHIFPAGGQRGMTVAVTVGTECVPPRAALRIWGEGVSAPEFLGDEVSPAVEPSPRRKPTEIPIHYPREWASEFKIAPDAAVGAVHWRLATAGGGMSARPFLVGDLPEYVERESNSIAERAELVSIPVTINGRIAGERDADYFRFVLDRGQSIVCEVAAARLGSPLDPVVEITDPRGERIDAFSARIGSDPVLAFVCETPGEHRLRITHVGFHGGPHYVYRVTLAVGPLATSAFPAGGQAGTEIDVTLLQFAGQAAAGRLREVVERIRIPAGVQNPFVYRSPNTSPAGLLLDAGELPECVEAAEHSTPAAAQALPCPITLNGRFLTPADEDWYQFSARAGELLEFVCRPAIGSSALPILELHAAAAASDAPLQRATAVESPGHAARFEWAAPQDGLYRLRAVDLQQGSRGGAEFVYRLSIRPAVPGFTLSLPADFLNMYPGGEAGLDVSIVRTGGFSGPIDLSVEELHESVKLGKAQVPAGAAQFKLLLTADAAALTESRPVRIVGTAKIGEQTVSRSAAAPHSGVDAEGTAIGSPTLEHVWLTVMHKPLFKLYCSEAYEYAYRGAVYPYVMDVERLNGFEGEIMLQRGDRQNRDLDGIEMLDCRVAPGVTRPAMPLYLPETMHINIQSQSQLYTQAYALFQDAAGRPQSMLFVSEKRNMLRTLPTVVKLQAAEPVIAATPAGEAVCRLQLQRTPNFTGAMELELVNASGCRAERAVIPAGETVAELRIRLPELAAASGSAAEMVRDVTIRATGRMSNGMTVVTETRVAVQRSIAP